jgi:hypothetical protein
MAKRYKTIITISLKIDELSVKFILSAPNRPRRGLIAETSWNLATQNISEFKDHSESEVFTFSLRREVP